MRPIMLAAGLLALSLGTACIGTSPALAAGDGRANPPRVGGGADRHGCYATAGYLWCARTRTCERPWELAKAKGFKLSSAAFARYCRNDR